MNPIQQECNNRGVQRLCHFTQSRNLAHIFGDSDGLLSTETLKAKNMPHNPTDSDRYDGRDDLVCFSIEYPNPFYFHKARSKDILFKDWVVLLIKPDHIWAPNTHFCPCNSASANGRYIKADVQGFYSLFAGPSPGRNWARGANHLSSVPTDLQAEVLVEEPIHLDTITGIIAKTEEQAKREVCRLELQGITMDKPIYISSETFEKDTLSKLIQNGQRPKMEPFERSSI